MKLVVIGNCQARPLAARLAVARGVSRADPIILHLARDEDEAVHTEAISSANIILAQATANDFRPRHLASGTLRAVYANRVLVWPNVFYAGQQPFLRYVTHSEAGRIKGPFDVYHDLRLLAAWRARQGLGLAPEQEAETQLAAEVSRDSLKTLRARETGCDVQIADMIEEHMAERRCFFTFNHPSGWLLDKLAERLGDHIGLTPLPPPPKEWEPLGRIAPPGMMLTEELRAPAFRIYDAIAPLLMVPEKLRTTPPFNGDAAWLGWAKQGGTR